MRCEYIHVQFRSFSHCKWAALVNRAWKDFNVSASTTNWGRRLYIRVKPKTERFNISKCLSKHLSSNCLLWRPDANRVWWERWCWNGAAGNIVRRDSCAIPKVHLWSSPSMATSRRKHNGARLNLVKASFSNKPKSKEMCLDAVELFQNGIRGILNSRCPTC